MTRVQSATAKWNQSVCGLMVSAVILLINELGNSRQLDICCTLINGS